MLNKVELRTADVLTGLAAIVGNTPLLPLRRLPVDHAPSIEVYAKAEWVNPGGSVKDRPALNILRTAIRRGYLGEGKRFLDSTSGNMGISYATFAASLGVPLTLVIPSSASPERIAVLRALGAQLYLSDPLEGSDGAMRFASQLSIEESSHFYYANQYHNDANWQAHYQGTGPEIWHQTQGRITHFVSGLGTSGTFIGVGRFLLEQNPDIQLIAVQPDSAFHGLEGLKHLATSEVPGIYDDSLADWHLAVSTEAAQEMTLQLARREGMFVGVSSGAAAVAAFQAAREIDNGVIVTLFPDSGYKYLSERFWESA